MTEGRILAICVVNNLVLVGTKNGVIVVFDALQHKKSHSLPRLPDSVICFKRVTVKGGDLLLAGLANGQLVVYSTEHLKLPGN